MENFLQDLYRIQENTRKPVGLSALARKLSVSPAAVAQMAGRLATEGWIRRRGRQGLELAPRGRAEALRLLRSHRLAERFFTDVLGLSLERAHVEAHRFEHVISEDVDRRLAELLGNPERCPCGQPIPSTNGHVAADRDLVGLDEVPPGHPVQIVRVADEDSRLLRYIETLRLLPGTRVVVSDKAPFDGPITLRAGRIKRAIGREVARRILVRAGRRSP